MIVCLSPRPLLRSRAHLGAVLPAWPASALKTIILIIIIIIICIISSSSSSSSSSICIIINYY